MKMKGKEGIQVIPGMEIIEEQEITEVDKGVPAGRIDIKTINKEGLKEIFPEIEGIPRPQEILIGGEKEVFPKTKDIPHPQEITTEEKIEVFHEVEDIDHPRETINSLMTKLDTTGEVTLGHPETEGGHHVPFQGTETDQEIGDIVNVIIHDLTPEDGIIDTEVEDLSVETMIEDPEIENL